MGVKLEYVGLEVMGRLKRNDGQNEDAQPFFEIRILTASLSNTRLPHVSTWAPATEVDEAAKTLSRMLKDDQEVWVMYRGCVKACYQEGVRKIQYDMRQAYPDLNDDDHKASKIRDSETNEWI